ncbi:MAG TPA: mitochondrial fission ELM1 family protein [Rhodanobacteraceae bacterium]|nr:mitochondrial fission ELM1 family protein [Rhodanobacteraceae bacterium]
MNDAWIITDGAAGNLRQARALARAAGLVPAEIVVGLRPPWAWSAPHLPRAAQFAIDNDTRRRLRPPWPPLAIGCGRAAAWVTRWLRRNSHGACFCVQILDPRITPRHWDMVIAPQHDAVRGDNVLNPLGSLNPVDSAWLATGRADFPELAELPQPRTAVLLGGPRRGVAFDAAHARALLDGLLALQARDGGSFMLSASPRTPAEFAHALREGLAPFPGLAFTRDTDGRNPYAGILAWADRAVVTPDSVNMLSEAAASGSPVLTLVPGPLPEKLARFHTALRSGGWLHDLQAAAVSPTQPLRETGDIGAELRRRLLARR